MRNSFAKTQYHVSDVYVADYTQFSASHSEFAGRGVAICDEKPDKIESLWFKNPNSIGILSVNFEENQSVFRPENKKTVPNCECMLVSERGNQKKWLALVELKYCKGADRNISTNFMNALNQLEETFVYLRDEKGILDNKQYRYFWVISMPEHSDKIPFSAFALSQDELMKYYERYKTIIISDNVVEIWTGSVIKLQ